MFSKLGQLRIVVAGYIVGGPIGGLFWHHFQYVLGLHTMGHQVLFVEDSDDYPSCYHPKTFQLSEDPTYGLQFTASVFANRGLANHWAYYHAHTQQWFGKAEREVINFCNSADLMLNLSGVNPLRPILAQIPHRAFIDTDPLFTQLRLMEEESSRKIAEKHSCFFTFGELIGHEKCTIPKMGLHWKPTRQPVVLSQWPKSPGHPNAAWSTVMQWDSYKTRSLNGVEYGMKSTSFDSYLQLPEQTGIAFKIALGSASAPRLRLESLGWKLCDPILVTETPESYQQFIQGSKGEWSVAKQGYVAAHTGWFSERSCAYLASGRPVVVQDTGFSQLIETGLGLLSFNNPAEACAALNNVSENYEQHCRLARELCAEYFDHRKVLQHLIDNCF